MLYKNNSSKSLICLINKGSLYKSRPASDWRRRVNIKQYFCVLHKAWRLNYSDHSSSICSWSRVSGFNTRVSSFPSGKTQIKVDKKPPIQISEPLAGSQMKCSTTYLTVAAHNSAEKWNNSCSVPHTILYIAAASINPTYLANLK